MVQGLGLGTFTAEGMGSIPGGGTEILQATQHGHRKGRKEGRKRGRKVRAVLPKMERMLGG